MPAYEDVVLGGLGRMASRCALVSAGPAQDATIFWGGEAFEAWLGVDPRGRAIAGLGEGLAQSLSEIIRDALATAEPVRSRCNRVSGGVVATTEILGLPLRGRTGERFVLVCLAGETTRTNLLKALFAATGHGMVAASAVRDPDGRPVDLQIIALNEAAAAMLGRPAEALIWQRVSVALPHLRHSAALALLFDALDGQQRVAFEVNDRAVAGAPRHLRIEGAPLGDLLGLILTDIDDSKARESSARLLFETNPLPMWVTGEDGRFLAVNDAAVAHYGFARDAFLSMDLSEIAVGTPAGFDGSSRHRRRDGSLIDVTAFTRAIPFEGRSARLTALVDVTSQRRAEARIVHMAHHDALTDLPNRVLFRERLMAAIAHQAAGGIVALLCLDLDRFKLVNDTLGHPAGDALLRQAAARLTACVPDGIVSRLGGDEFAILVGVPEREAASAIGERVIAALTRPFTIGGHEVCVGASVGIALAPGDAGDPDMLLRKADMALYAAKAAGRRTARAFEPAMEAEIQARRALERDLRAAFAASGLQVHYQPQRESRDLGIVGCEALLRWNHPERGFISPAEFVPIAEDIGLIGPLGEWVLRTACREAAGWARPVRVAVNLSPLQFRTADLAGQVRAVLAESGLDPRRLELEITESVLLSDSAANIALLHDLRALGVRIAIDDFGIGYSSLSYLRTFPFDKIKIDRSFTAALGSDPHSAAIVRAVADLAVNLGMDTVAEGVETQEQSVLLRLCGCTELQGFLLGRPVPAEEFRRLVAMTDIPPIAA
ncbi:putative bifunctional diguanylate cyclase/phosphodiesterase [Methylobacterium sp. ID0610]|uniref:putative bifunctional diguanylate cyclase/phosphodiesterase n=1 Tax=Methylobacterium carpenticola TaxID=3344827 RepID=UPI00369A73DD